MPPLDLLVRIAMGLGLRKLLSRTDIGSVANPCAQDALVELVSYMQTYRSQVQR